VYGVTPHVLMQYVTVIIATNVVVKNNVNIRIFAFTTAPQQPAEKQIVIKHIAKSADSMAVPI